MHQSPPSTSGKRIVQITCNETQCIDPIGIVGEWERIGPHSTFDLSSGWELTWACPDFIDEYAWRSPIMIIPENKTTFNAEDTCRVLGNNTVLLIGDSTMQQFFTTLVHLLTNCHTQLVFEPSDTLVGRAYGRMNRGKKWADCVRQHKPDIVIVTVGAHIYTDDNSFMGIVHEVLYDMQHMQQESNSSLKFAWKTQSPGGCTKDIQFLTNPVEVAQKFNFSDKSYYKDVYNCWQFNRDLLLLSTLQEFDIPSIDMRMLYSRSDAHPSSQSGREIMKGVLSALLFTWPSRCSWTFIPSTVVRNIKLRYSLLDLKYKFLELEARQVDTGMDL